MKKEFHKYFKKLVIQNAGLSQFVDYFNESINHFEEFEDSHLEETELKNWYEQIVNSKFLEKYISKDVNEIIFHSPSSIWSQGKSKIQEDSLSISKEDFDLSFHLFAIKNNIVWNNKRPFASFGLEIHGHPFRFTLIHKSLGNNPTSKCFIRKHVKRPLPLNSFGSMTLQSSELYKKNILIAGATGSGKTTFLQSYYSTLPSEDNLILLEDCREIILNKPQVTFLESSENSPLWKLLEYAMRMKPDSIGIGELRGEEVISYYLALNTGHHGVATTIHANSATDAILRVAQLLKFHHSHTEVKTDLLLKSLCQNIDLVIFIEDKKIKEVIKPKGAEDGRIYFDNFYDLTNSL